MVFNCSSGYFCKFPDTISWKTFSVSFQVSRWSCSCIHVIIIRIKKLTAYITKIWYSYHQIVVIFRSRLVDHAYGLYFRNQTYYRVSNLDSRIENADHRLTDEISAFTSAVAHLYSHVSKPILDIILVLWELRYVSSLSTIFLDWT